MDHPDAISFDSNPYLRHEAQIWELDCLAEQEIRSWIKMIIMGWFNAYGSSTPHRKFAANESWRGHYMHPYSSSVRSDSPDVEVYDACSALPRVDNWKPDQTAMVDCSSPSEFSPSSSSRESTPEKSDEGVRIGCPPATLVSPSSSRESTSELPELSSPPQKRCIRRSARTRPATSEVTRPSPTPSPVSAFKHPWQKSSASSSASPTSSSTRSTQPQPNPTRTGGSLPPGAFWDRRTGTPVAHCGLPGCTQKCRSAADVRRHRESLAHRAEEADALKRHLGAKSAARCGEPGMGARRDEFLGTEAAREAQRAGKPDRVVIALYNTFLGGISTKTGSLKTGGRKRY
ncbi:hypothetical protein B0H14DRAFT_3425517 [Mycena olivaceomarginata]|nr:hypothetical protein B0H14DRAFT_3425517 [Mycena olivaceomarginata]